MNGAIPFSQLGQIHQYATVSSGSQDQRIYYLKIPNSCVGFLNRLGGNWFDSTKLKFIIDGAIVERNIERQIGPMGNPAKINPPFLVKDHIEFKADNNDTSDHIIEVLCDGVAYHVASTLAKIKGD